MEHVFLGGTCNGSQWREALIPLLHCTYFNPVVSDWTPECQEIERAKREGCDVCLYVITPAMTGVYSIAEVVDDSNKRPEKTIFCFIEPVGEAFSSAQWRSLLAVGALVKQNGGQWLRSLNDVASALNAGRL